MGLIKEPKEIDFSVKSEPWTDKELFDFREIMKKSKENKLKTVKTTKISKKRELVK